MNYIDLKGITSCRKGRGTIMHGKFPASLIHGIYGDNKNPKGKMKDFSIIVTCDKYYGIGWMGSVPWVLPEDAKIFYERTTPAKLGKHNCIIMGRRTWESIPPENKPLKQRFNYVISGNKNLYGPEIKVCSSLREALIDASNKSQIDKIFVIGGAWVFLNAVQFNNCKEIFMTWIGKDYRCTSWFPRIFEDYFDCVKTQTLITPLLVEVELRKYKRVKEIETVEIKNG